MTETVKAVRPVLRWLGRKSRLMKHLLPLVPEHVCYCEPFAGSLAMLLAKPRAKVEVVNDLNGDLVALYRNLQFHLPAVSAELDWLFSSRKNFADFLQQPGLTELQRAARFLLVNRTSFGGNMNSFGVAKTAGGGVGFNKQVLGAVLGPVKERLNGVVIENISYERCFGNYDSKDSFFFIDPPYLGTVQKAYASWTEDDLRLFRKRVGKLQGKWVVTLNDVPFNRDLFAGCNILATETQNRLGNNRTSKGKILGEIIITPQ
jgi:DNA adenine methylase